MKNLFNSVKVSVPNSNYLDLSHDFKFTGNMGYIYPVQAIPTIPSDRFNIESEAMIRLMPMIAPVMQLIECTITHFFCPNRLLWPNWDEFWTLDVSNPSPPFITLDTVNYALYPLLDYMRLPDPLTNSFDINALPFAAYQKIYDEYYRDQNNITSDWQELVDGNNNGTIAVVLPLRKRAWEHDYFTACLPTAQKGAEIDIPIGTVDYNDNWASGLNTNPRFRSDNDAPATAGDLFVGAGGTGEGNATIYSAAANTEALAYDPQGTLVIAPTTINDLRRAFKLQEYLEKLMRGGSRPAEVIRNIFGITPQDARLQRPEYIVGSKSAVTISEVLNTSDTASAPQGNMAGHGISYVNGNRSGYFCQEHGWIISLLSVLPKTAYYQGIPREFSKRDPLDYFTPQFAHLGEQEVLNKELYAPSATPEAVFGYLPRYTEYKFIQSAIAGQFKTTLDFWTMARKFATDPALNQAFIEASPTHDIFAVTDPDEHKLVIHCHNRVGANRPMPIYGTPTF